MNELESKIQRRCQKIITDSGAFVFKTHGDIYMKKGIPDLIACMPTDISVLEKMLSENYFADNKIGIFTGIEVKRKNLLNTVSDAQAVVGKQIQKSGGLWYAVDNSDIVEAIVELMRGKI